MTIQCDNLPVSQAGPRLLPDGKLRRTCLLCGCLFVASSSDRMYCSKRCAGLVNFGCTSSVCVHCGKHYTPKRSNRTTYCSRECAFAHKGQQAVARELGRLQQVRIVVQHVCMDCGEHVKAKRLRCDECTKRVKREKQAQRDAANKSIETLTCSECGKRFDTIYGVTNKRFCSVECGRVHSRRVEKAKRRARQRAVAYESIDPIAVFERDGWRCHICGGLTLPFLRGSIEPDAPELDHVVALANGGAHTWGNVACAHRRCNQDKGALQ